MILTFLKHNWGWMILIIILMSTCNRYRLESNTAHLNADKLLDTVRYYKLKNGSVVASKAVLEYNDKQMKTLVKSSNKTVQQIAKKFNKVETVVKSITETKIDSITVTYTEPVLVDFKREGLVIDTFYSFNYNSSSKGFKISNLKLTNDTVTYVKGNKRSWLLGKNTSTLDINHSNPFIKDIKIDVAELKEDKRWYETTLFKVGIGVIGGIILTEQLK